MFLYPLDELLYTDFLKIPLKLQLKIYIYMKFTQSSGFFCLLTIKTMNIFYLLFL